MLDKFNELYNRIISECTDIQKKEDLIEEQVETTEQEKKEQKKEEKKETSDK